MLKAKGCRTAREGRVANHEAESSSPGDTTMLSADLEVELVLYKLLLLLCRILLTCVLGECLRRVC